MIPPSTTNSAPVIYFASSEAINLPAIQSIYLAGNQLSGPIPNFSGLSFLTSLDLSRNEFYGEINIAMLDNIV